MKNTIASWTEEKRKQVSKKISNGVKQKLKSDKSLSKRRGEKIRGRKHSKESRKKMSDSKLG